MMVSLRSRLVAALLVLAALGLIGAGAITYAEQRSFLYDRTDQQARAALPAVSHRLDQGGSTVPGGVPPGFGHGGPAGRPPLGGPRGDGDLDNLPPGTYGQRRDASGRVVGKTTVLYSIYGQKPPAAPKIPAHLTAGKYVTVDSVDSSLRYRLVALPNLDQPGTTVVAVPLRDVDQTLNRLLIVELLVIGGVLIALAVLAWVLVRVGLRPLDRIAATAGAIAGGDLSHRIEHTDERTEVGRLGLALNAMLGRLEQAFSERQASENRLRRFIADASHELRTPLASIRGYAELFRIGAADDPADVEKAMGRIEDEAARMGVLVEDLLTLARLDEVREPTREPVDIASLAEDAVADARAIAPDRAVSLEARGETVVSGDSHQLRQVLANLTRNALTHTPAGTPVEVGVSETADHVVVISVRDHGPGLPNGDTDTLFERFWRAEAGRERGKAGAGLGLAIVAGIVSAHHGSVGAANAPGGGAVFTVRLPAFVPAASLAVSGISQERFRRRSSGGRTFKCMPTPQNPSAVFEARRRLAARRARVARIRRRVVAGSLAAFVISFATIAETGALGSTTVATTSRTATTAAIQTDTNTFSSGSDDQATNDQSTDDQSSQDTVSPVTTSQS